MPETDTTTAATARSTVKVGLIGQGIGLSRTPAMHMAEGREQGLRYEYEIMDVDDPKFTEHSLAQFLEHAEASGFAGLNVTYPFKISVIEHLDALSENARALGAVNTVVFRNGKRFGHNTDLWGFSESFRHGMAGATTGDVLLLGAGGAGMAVAHALLSSGVERLWIYDTEGERLRNLVFGLRKRFNTDRAAPVDAPEAAADRIDGLVNATPVGMAKLPGCPFPKHLLRPDMWVADIVYFPLETELLAAARAAGCRVLPGSGMAVYQAVRAFELFTGKTPDPGRMRATFESLGA
ncbi:MAG: shikimate dehydrogenase [Paracoccaceae bacterium]